MEPVPETERMEEFRASPVPTRRLQESSLYDFRDAITKPPNIRRSTEPTPRSPTLPSPSLPYRTRNTSPFSRGHLRSKSTASTFAPSMGRTQSMPGVNTAGHLLISPRPRPSSPLGYPNPIRIARKPVDDVFPGLPNRALKDLNETGALNTEDLTPRATERSSSPIQGLPQTSPFPRSRRSASPLRYLSQSQAANGLSTPTTPSSAGSSPFNQPSRFDSFLGTSSYSNTFSYPGSFASSSVPSTPTSARSRSPSISSLETIPDTPDAEEAALEAERIAQLKADADAADGGEYAKGKPGLEASGDRGRTLGLVFGSRDKRKRWSVCGAERRGDLNLDTIWED